MIREAIELFETRAADRHIELAVSIDDDLPCIDADRSRLLQVLSNLFDNALKFSRPDTIIVARGGRARVRDLPRDRRGARRTDLGRKRRGPRHVDAFEVPETRPVSSAVGTSSSERPIAPHRP